jgi:sirohydrochlorin cobaltochelatase
MADAIERAGQAAFARGLCYVGQIAVWPSAEGGFILSHRDEKERTDLNIARDAENAAELARFDDYGSYRPLKTAPNLRHGWRLEVATFDDLTRALDHFYPGRLAVFVAWQKNQLETTTLRETLARQSGMYHVAAKISDAQIDDVVASFCRSNGGCLRTILWRRDASGLMASSKLPPEKFDTSQDQTLWPGSTPPATAIGAGTLIPLLCQEACNLLVAECRRVVKDEKPG